MGDIVFAGLMPHPPIAVPEVGGREVEKVQSTVQGMKRMARSLVDSGAKSLIIITPHGPVYQDALSISVFSKMQGDLGQFNAPGVVLKYENNLSLVAEIKKQSQKSRISLAEIGGGIDVSPWIGGRLDHGVTVPLYYLEQGGWNGRLVPISIGLLARDRLFEFGKGILKAIRELNQPVAVVASGDLSHRLLPGAPAGYDPQGQAFDAEICAKLSRADAQAILNLPEDLVKRAGECGLGPLLVLLGALNTYQVKAEKYSYEGPFGVGYLICELKTVGPAQEQEKPDDDKEAAFLRFARESLESYILNGKVIEPPETLPPELLRKAGCFVTLKKRGKLRGCIGTIFPTRESLALEIIYNALEAGLRDPRFPPVQKEELHELEYSVDVLGTPEPVRSEKELDPKEYGVVVRCGHRTGLLLPNLEGVDTVEEQVSIAKQKAGIKPGENCLLERFTVTRYEPTGGR